MLEGSSFLVPYHFEQQFFESMKDDCKTGRLLRLAMETAKMAENLKIRDNSSIFYRTDLKRLDIVKLLITGPKGSPFAYGCYEFDIYFPSEYPESPFLINLSNRENWKFLKNVQPDGKINLDLISVENWHPDTTLWDVVKILQVKMFSEPDCDAPKCARQANTVREIKSRMCLGSVRDSIVKAIKSPSACFKEVVSSHFWLKKEEICDQVSDWIVEFENPRERASIIENKLDLEVQLSQFVNLITKMRDHPDSIEEGTQTSTQVDMAIQTDPPAKKNWFSRN